MKHAQSATDYVNLKLNLKMSLNENPSINWEIEKQHIFGILLSEWKAEMDDSQIDELINLNNYE